MSEISFVQTLLLFIMSSCPNLLWEALAPSLPSSGKKLKLNPKVEEKKKQRDRKRTVSTLYYLCPLCSTKVCFFPGHLLSHSKCWEKTQKYCFLEKSIIIHGHFLFFSLSPLSLSLFLPVYVVFNTVFLSLCSPELAL